MIRRVMNTRVLGLMLLLSALTATVFADGITITAPVNGAIVRESVKFFINPSDNPGEGYVSIDIDGTFNSAHILSSDIKDPVFIWNTKDASATPGQPDVKQYVPDGQHSVVISIYGTGNKLVGTDTVTVNVANKINVPASQGVMLAYKWREDEVLKYARDTKLREITNGVSSTLQSSSIKFMRVVEDLSGGAALIRDKVLPTGLIVDNGRSDYVDNLYKLKSNYRDVSRHGSVIDTLPPLTPGDHFGFSIPVLPDRRVSVGDSWEAPVEVALQWASDKPASILAEARLEDFEWQDRYPTARIRETYSGPVVFYTDSGARVSLDNFTFERIIYFAYNSGRLIKTDTTVNVGGLTSDQVSELGLNSTPAPTAPQMGGPFGPGGPPGGPGGAPGSSYGPGMAPPGSFPPVISYGAPGSNTPAVTLTVPGANQAPDANPQAGARGGDDSSADTTTENTVDVEFTEHTDILASE